jgi:hypothetical protein
MRLRAEATCRFGPLIVLWLTRNEEWGSVENKNELELLGEIASTLKSSILAIVSSKVEFGRLVAADVLTVCYYEHLSNRMQIQLCT